nr:MAG TPA: hypothetical protein [Caudoviricetes sp.]
MLLCYYILRNLYIGNHIYNIYIILKKLLYIIYI